MPAKQPQPKGSGGSALKRLKTSLRSAGVVGNQSKSSRSKKQRKRGVPTEVGKNSTADKLKVIRDEFNPFEIKQQRTKFDVIGRKVKGVGGKPALNKQIGEENRKKTLLQEMKSKGHVGGIIDRRFGENNPNLTPEEKMLERFTREKQKAAKATTSLFNLEDDDGEMGLTHYGQSLAEMDDFDDTGLRLSDDEESGQLSKDLVSQMHFGGFDQDKQVDDDGKPKSRAEIMKEIIAKSKYHKYERQMEKRADEDMREDLDEELKDIRDLLDTKPKRKPLVSQSALFARQYAEADDNEEEKQEEEKINNYADYDQMLQELARDKRAMATDRTKTEEELALEEKEKLEKAERARKRRMEGLDSESEDEGKFKNNRKRRKGEQPQGDDLDDDYLEELDDEVNRLGAGLTLEDIQNAAAAADEDEESGDEEDADEDEEDDEDEDEEDEDDDEMESDYGEDLEDEDDQVPTFDDDDDDMNEIGTNGIVKKAAKKKSAKNTTSEKSEIPYTFECPTTHDEFLEIVSGLALEHTPTVVKRIRILYHVKLHPENKTKMATFLSVLVDHLAYLASTVSPFPSKIIDTLIGHAFEIAQKLPNAAADVFLEKLKTMHSTMTQKMNHNSSSAFPDVEDITVLRCLGKVFPTSDLSHPVVTPAMLYMSQTLSLCRVRSEIDIGRGIFVCLLFHEYQSVSKRFIPEALNFLQHAIVLLSPKDLFEQVPGTFPMPDEVTKLHIADTNGSDLETVPNLALERLSMESVEKQERNTLRLSMLQSILRLLTRYIQLYASTPALVEIFEPMQTLIAQTLTVSWHDDIQTLLNTLQDRLARQIKFCKDKRAKMPLRMQHHRPIPIAQHLPKFEQRYSLDKHYDPDHERAQRNKLEAQVKKERKGAIRELRKDARFMSREKAKQRKEKDEEYNKMIRGVMSMLETDQAEKNRLERQKRK